jgi:hypothetical protein
MTLVGPDAYGTPRAIPQFTVRHYYDAWKLEAGERIMPFGVGSISEYGDHYNAVLNAWLNADYSGTIPPGVWLTPESDIKIGSDVWWELVASPAVVVPVSDLRRLLFAAWRATDGSRDYGGWPYHANNNRSKHAAVVYAEYLTRISRLNDTSIDIRYRELYGSRLPNVDMCFAHGKRVKEATRSDFVLYDHNTGASLSQSDCNDIFVSFHAKHGLITMLHAAMRVQYNKPSVLSDTLFTACTLSLS